MCVFFSGMCVFVRFCILCEITPFDVKNSFFVCSLLRIPYCWYFVFLFTCVLVASFSKKLYKLYITLSFASVHPKTLMEIQLSISLGVFNFLQLQSNIGNCESERWVCWFVINMDSTLNQNAYGVVSYLFHEFIFENKKKKCRSFSMFIKFRKKQENETTT